MRTTPTLSFLVVFTCALTASASAAEPGRLKLPWGRYSVVAGVKMFTPESRATRDVFGDTKFDPDLRLWRFDMERGVHFAYELGYTRFTKNKQTADFISTGLGVQLQLAEPDQALVPYWIVRGGPYFPKVSGHGRRVTAGANTELGLVIAGHVVVAARYDLMDRVNGYRLSGYTGRVGIKLF
jgi:hypothetical protein